MQSLDQAVAVGDRGLILYTSNGGRTWNSVAQRSEKTLYDVHIQGDGKGMVVGGTIEPLTLRSVGEIQVTTNGGESWDRIHTTLPRLLGIHALNPGTWIAWGDWSNTYQSSLFSTADGGKTWTSMQLPCGHLQALGVYQAPYSYRGPGFSPGVANAVPGETPGPHPQLKSPPQLVAIDRLGRGYASWDGSTFQPLNVPMTPYQSYRFCRCIDGEWWIGGSGGFLQRSRDGENWEQVSVPGTASDMELIDFHSITSAGDHRWLAGDPGTVVWHSSDRGKTWNVVPTPQSPHLHSIHALDESVLMACGEGGSIYLSRNGGTAWSLSHGSTRRVAVLNLASTTKSVAWEALAHTVHDARRASAAIVVHDQNIEERSSSQPESGARIAEAGQQLGLIASDTWRSHPVSSHLHAPRRSDLVHYQSLGAMHTPPQSTLVRRLVHAIRSYQPDVLINDCPFSGGELQSKLSEAIELATTWSRRREYHLFSEESGIPNTQWDVVRVLYRGTRSGGLHFSRSSLIEASGGVLGEILFPIQNIASPYEVSSYPKGGEKYYYRTLGTRYTTIKDPFDSLSMGSTTQLTERPLGVGRANTILKTSAWYEYQQFVPESNFNPLVRDRNWEERLLNAMRGIETANRFPVLYEIAIRNRQLENWNHWFAALELILAEGQNSYFAEAATLELMQYHGSLEAQRLIANRIQQMESRVEENVVTPTHSVTSSPFVKMTEHTGNEPSMVQQASYSHAPRRIPVSVGSGLPEFHRMLGRFPGEWRNKREENQFGWLIASRYRSLRATGVVPDVAEIELARLWPAPNLPLLEFQHVRQQEQRLYAFNNQPTNIGRSEEFPKVPPTGSRPHLDGVREEGVWPASPQIVLRDPWGEDSGTSSIYLAQDEEFFYLFSEVTASTGSSEERALAKRNYDMVQVDQEQIRLRIDLDRDYATWFELAWNRDGETSDQFNDIRSWNPVWYVAVSETESGWNAEIAIPRSELLTPETDLASASSTLGMNVWGLNAIHLRPSISTRSPQGSVSDRFQKDQWVLVDTGMKK